MTRARRAREWIYIYARFSNYKGEMTQKDLYYTFVCESWMCIKQLVRNKSLNFGSTIFDQGCSKNRQKLLIFFPTSSGILRRLLRAYTEK